MNTSISAAELKTKPVLFLIAFHNALSDTKIKSWKQKKDGLVKKIELIRMRTKPPVTAKKKDRVTIERTACVLISTVVKHVNDSGEEVAADAKGARPYGLSYMEILKRIKERFPGCETTYNCLRCYAGRMRAGWYGPEFENVPVHRAPSKWKNQ